MRKILLYTIILAFFACNNDDDGIGLVDGLVPFELNKNFLIDEKWFFESATSDIPYDLNGDGIKTTDLNSQIAACDLDSYYVFEGLQPDKVIFLEGENECENSVFRYNSPLDFTVFPDREVLDMDTRGGELLGGFPPIFFLEELQFLQSRDSSFKLLRCKIRVLDENDDVVYVNYTLKASIDNRPE